jgi:enterochelin esterase-like enzyme
MLLKYLQILLLIFLLSTNDIYSKPKNDSSFVRSDTIFSRFLNQKRVLSIYLPKGYSLSQKYPVIYAADGQKMLQENYLRALDSLIENGIIEKTIIIGVNSNTNNVPNKGKGIQYRHYEYYRNFGESTDIELNGLFEKHLNFFIKEVIPYAEKNYSAEKKAEKRIFYGCSNGAGFGITLASEYPDLIMNYICFSIAGSDYSNLKWRKNTYPKIHLSYGDKELLTSHREIKKFSTFLTDKGFKFELNIYSGAHDGKSWQKEFIRVISILNSKRIQHSLK